MPNKRVIVTRPRLQAEAWCEALKRESIDAHAAPVLEIVPVDDPSAKQAIKTHIVDLDNYAYLIFVSQNAVSEAFTWIEEYWPQFPIGVQCYGVGKKTVEALNDKLSFYGMTVSDAFSENAPMDSEALLETSELQQVSGSKILIFRGQGGRTKLQEVLSERGAEVHHCELYQRQVPSSANDDLAQVCQSVEEDIFAVFSGESLSNLHQQLTQLFPEQWQAAHLIVPSKRVADEAQGLGFTHIKAASNATETAMHQALLEWL